MLIRSLAALAFFAMSLPLVAADNFYLKNGDRVVFYGDSITDQRLYTVITEMYIVTRYPRLDVSFVHSGWGGDRVTGGGGGPIDLRLDRDVLAYKPTVMTIMLGMNDGSYRAETEATDKTYFDGYRHIVDKMKAGDPGVRITAIQPSPYDDITRAPNFPGGYNEVMRSFGKWIANYANEANLQVADLNTPVVAMLRKADQLDAVEAPNIIKDRVHPGFSGHLIMAEGLIKAWNGRALVSSVAIEAGGKPKSSAEYAQVADLATNNGGLSWTETEEALPLPFAKWKEDKSRGPVDLVLRSSGVSDELNNEQLKVAGLKSGVYMLKIDGQSVGDFNNDELSRGINLGLLDTPMAKQAEEVFQLTVAHCNVHNDRWRNVQVPLAPYSLPAAQPAIQAADELEKAILQKRSQSAQPKAHKFELMPAA
jgi:lysophospholipase L1-like esterase